MKSWILVILLLGIPMAWPSPYAQAQGPDYSLPGEFALPWMCGQGYRVSWEPEDHWEHGRATGIAYDFAIPVGVPLYAPTGGTAHFLRDERPLEINLGNYVDLVDDTGQWLVRLAHLRDAQEGRRRVRAGELIGHSGASGAQSPHLHLELLVRSGDRWVRPEMERLSKLYGLPRGDLVLGSLIVNPACPAELTMDGEVTPSQAAVTLGESVDLSVPVFSQGLEPLRFTLAQIALYSTYGDSAMVEAQGDWHVGAKAGITLTLSARLPSAGDWYVGRLTYHTEQGTRGLPARGHVQVIPSPLRYIGLAISGAPSMGIPLRLYVWVENQGTQPVRIDGLFVDGLRPDGAHWRVIHAGPLTLAPGGVRRLLLEGDVRFQQVGSWALRRVGYLWEGHEYQIALLQRELVVSGPHLVVERLDLFRSADMAHLFLQVRNIGTALAEPEAVEIWGSKPDEESFSQHIRPTAPLEPGQATLLQLDIHLGGLEGLWRLVEAGYWQQGVYYEMALPMQPGIEALESDEPGSPSPEDDSRGVKPRSEHQPLPE